MLCSNTLNVSSGSAAGVGEDEDDDDESETEVEGGEMEEKFFDQHLSWPCPHHQGQDNLILSSSPSSLPYKPKVIILILLLLLLHSTMKLLLFESERDSLYTNQPVTKQWNSGTTFHSDIKCEITMTCLFLHLMLPCLAVTHFCSCLNYLHTNLWSLNGNFLHICSLITLARSFKASLLAWLLSYFVGLSSFSVKIVIK